jgi:hypothetical protein
MVNVAAWLVERLDIYAYADCADGSQWLFWLAVVIAASSSKVGED